MPPAANTTVTYEVNNPQAQGVQNAAVTAQLIGVGDRNDEGTVITSQISTTTDANGAFSLSLVPNSAYRQANTYYAVNIANGPSYSIVVPVSGTAVSLWDCRVDPATLAPSTVVTPPVYLARSERGVASGVASLGADGLVPTGQLPAGSSTPDATTTSKGIVQLAGDLAGTAAAPTVPGLANRQPLDADLTAIAALTPANDDVLQRKAGAWTNRTLDQLIIDMALAISDVAGLQAALDAKIAAALADNKGDLFAATAADSVTRLAVGADGRLLMADSSQTTGLRWSTRTAPAYDPAMDGLVACAADPIIFRVNSGIGAPGGAVRMVVPAGKPITGVLTCLHSAGVVGAGGTNGYAVNDDAGTLVSSTVDDNNLFTATGMRAKAFAAQIAAQNTDRYVYVSVRVSGYTTDPGFAYTDGSGAAARLDGLQGGKRRYLLLSGSAWGAIDPVNGTSGAGFMPFLALY